MRSRMLSIAVSVERWLFYHHVDVTQFPNQHMCETALTRRLVIIGTIAANAPYIGLLRTILGIMITFHTMAISGTKAVRREGRSRYGPRTVRQCR